MYDFITFDLKCPVCNHLLMDETVQVDNNPAIKLNIEIEQNKGEIYLSPVYGSYNYLCNINTPDNKIAVFSCPHCNSNLISKNLCELCEAPMVPFNLTMGGRVSICSRSGCQNHFVEFNDLELALKKLYQEHGFRGRKYPGRPPETNQIKVDEQKDDFMEIIETGTFLKSYCPHCLKSVIEDNKLKLKITKGKSGFLYLSPYLNVFTSRSTIFLQENENVENLLCPHCDKSIMVQGKSCESCGSPVAKILIGAQTKMIDFYLCSKKGCRWHGLSDKDFNDIRLDDSLEW